MKLQSLSTLVVLSCLSAAMVPIQLDSQEQTDELRTDVFTASVKKIHTRDRFTDSTWKTWNPIHLDTDENYDRYVQLVVEEYQREFSTEEISVLADCLGSSLGQRFLDSKPESYAWARLVADVPIPKNPRKDAVTLGFDGVNLIDSYEFLVKTSGKGVALHPSLFKHNVFLISSEPRSREDALERLLNRLRLDGLRVTESEYAIVINPAGAPAHVAETVVED